MKIFVTGGCGFIGSNFIIKQIDENENHIFNYDKLTYAANQNNLLKIENNSLYEFQEGDINDKKNLAECINKFKPNYIINFAAESHVDRSIDGPKDFIMTNIVGTFELLQSALFYYNSLSNFEKLKFKFLHVSTDEVYGSLGSNGFFTEKTAYSPSSPYSASKASSDHLVRSWGITYKLPILITNCSNNYGPYQFPEKLIPLMIINCINNDKLPIYGDGSNIRDWLYVSDHCDALYKVLAEGEIGETYNIGGNEEKTNLEIVNTLCEILDIKLPSKLLSSYKELITFVNDRPGHDFRYAIDSTKIHENLKWKPKFNFRDALEKTVDWYLNNQHWWKTIVKNKYDLDRLGEL